MSYFPETTIKDIVVALRGVFTAISNPAWVDKTLNRVRETAIIESGTVTTVSTVTTVTTVSTVTGLTNVDGYQGRLLVINQTLGAWASTCRARIS